MWTVEYFHNNGQGWWLCRNGEKYQQFFSLNEAKRALMKVKKTGMYPD